MFKLSSLFNNLLRYARVFAQVILFSIYFHNIFEHISVFANLVTYSDSFTRDLLTYLFRNSEDMLRRHTEVHKAGSILHFSVARDVGTIEFIKEATKNFFAKNMMVHCRAVDGATVCTIKDSLILKLHKVVQEWLGAEEETIVPLVTLGMYNFYAIIGWLVGLNVFLFLCFNLAKRLMRFEGIGRGLFDGFALGGVS